MLRRVTFAFVSGIGDVLADLVGHRLMNSVVCGNERIYFANAVGVAFQFGDSARICIERYAEL